MKILISGSSGLVGSALRAFWSSTPHEVVCLVRSRPCSNSSEVFWNPDTGVLNPIDLQGIDAVVHLAGENLATGRWTVAKKDRIRDSRVQGTRLIAESIASAESGPQSLICASGIGFYGSRGAERLSEISTPGHGFLAEVCREWEAAAEPARAKTIRVVHLRFGMILSAGGGALAKMLPIFKMGLGGIIGSGQQFWSWIAIDDVVRIMEHVLESSELSGPVNAVAPEPVTNREFTKTLGGVLSRPTLFSVPAVVARMAFGGMADEALLASTRAEPVKLLSSGFRFRYPQLRGALDHILGRS